VEICWKYKWDIQLLLTDIIMLMVNGRDLARRLIGNQARAACQGVAGKNFLPKPFTEDVLMRKTRSVLDHSGVAETCWT
jgi:hypothetical protein